jgi:hypothetical protein
MKRNSTTKYTTTFLVAFILITMVLVNTPFAGNANSSDSVKKLNENATTVKLAASDNSTLAYNIKVNNASGEKFTLVIHNQEGEIVFIKSYTDKSYSKQIRLERKDNNSRYFFSIWKTGNDFSNSKIVECIDAN